MAKFPLPALLVTLLASACVGTQGAPAAHTGPTEESASELDWPIEFAAAPSARMTLSEWNALLERVKSLPGAVVEDDGPMLASVRVGPPNEPSLYLFTQPAHPAHPADVKASPSASGKGTTLVVGYAGSQSEFEAFVRSFLEHLRRSE